MAVPILIMGEVGTGKTSSLRNLDPNLTFVISADKKPLALPKASTNYKTTYDVNGKVDLQNSNYFETQSPQIVKALLTKISNDMPNIKYIILDTITSIMVNEYMTRFKEKGFDKFSDMALDTYEIITMLRDLREDLFVIVCSHTENNYDSEGTLRTSFKVPGGKLIGQNIKPEAYFHMILYTDVVMNNGTPEYYFRTQNNGKDTCRSPFGLFETARIPNDLSEVIAKYKEYER